MGRRPGTKVTKAAAVSLAEISQPSMLGSDSPLLIKAGVLPFIKRGDNVEDWLFYLARPRYNAKKHKHSKPPLPLQLAKGTRKALFEGKWRDIDKILRDEKVCKELGIPEDGTLPEKLAGLTEDSFRAGLGRLDPHSRLEAIDQTAHDELKEELGVKHTSFEGPMYPLGVYPLESHSGTTKRTWMYAVQLQSQNNPGKPDPKITEECCWVRLGDIEQVSDIRESQRRVIRNMAKRLWEKEHHIPFTDRVKEFGPQQTTPQR